MAQLKCYSAFFKLSIRNHKVSLSPGMLNWTFLCLKATCSQEKT